MKRPLPSPRKSCPNCRVITDRRVELVRHCPDSGCDLLRCDQCRGYGDERLTRWVNHQ